MTTQTQDIHQAGENSTMSVEAIPKLFEELERVDRAAKRLSLTEKCPTCGQTIPAPNKSPFRNSYQSVKETVELSQNEEVQQVPVEEDVKPLRGLRFWSIIMALIVVGAVAALEGTIVGTALPTSKPFSE
jgi:hypothetical protein